MGIIRVDNKRNTLTYQGIGHRIYLNLCGVRYLFDTGDDKHLALLAC